MGDDKGGDDVVAKDHGLLIEHVDMGDADPVKLQALQSALAALDDKQRGKIMYGIVRGVLRCWEAQGTLPEMLAGALGAHGIVLMLALDDGPRLTGSNRTDIGGERQQQVSAVVDAVFQSAGDAMDDAMAALLRKSESKELPS